MGKNTSPRSCFLYRSSSYGSEQCGGLFQSGSWVLAQGEQWRMLRLISNAASQLQPYQSP